jgi:hypothetical protein
LIPPSPGALAPRISTRLQPNFRYRSITMNRYGLALASAALLLAGACGGKETAPVVSTAAEADHAAMDHSKHGAAAAHDHAAMGHGATSTAGHAATAHGTSEHAEHAGHAGHAATDHRATQHGSTDHSAHSNTAAPDEAAAHAQHGQTAAPSPAHAGHAMPSAPTPNVALNAPTSNAEISRVAPQSTLRPDAFDAPAPSAVSEAQKAAAPANPHAGHGKKEK